MCSSCPYSPLMCSWLPERPWCLMQFSCPVVSIRIEFQRGVLKDTERLKAPVLLDGTCCVPLENQSAALFAALENLLLSLLRLARKNTRPVLCAPACAGSYARPSPPAQTLTLSRLRRPSRVPADPCTFPLAPALTCSADPYAFPPAPALTRSRLRLTASAFSTILSFHSSSGASS